ncbi:formate/nitrite transporter family protein [Aggregatilinea lenta]|uniref:formate/nitrite transporter family protein n=1 Tax=Aggregatilinea lenta TaxID=913108 RepID=UPI001EE808DA|nr:formate transporter FocA [Aggregatilinea lenta]
MENQIRIDALLPSEMAQRAETIGAAKAVMGAATMFALAVLAGAFISLGALFATTTAAGTSGVLPFGVAKLLTGLVFCLGLILVVVGGAELFTGNNLIVMAWASGKVSTRALLRNWGIVYAGNFAGSIGTAVLVLLSKQYTFGGGAVGKTVLSIATAKMQYGFVQAVALGILCNGLVCLAVWLTYSARSTTDKIMAIVFPITAFVAAGFEHSVANMYFIPLGLFIKAFDVTWATASGVDLSSLTWEHFLVNNLLPVTIGNIIGGTVLVALIYWFVYLRDQRT